MGARESWRDWVPQPRGEPFRQVVRFPDRPGLWDLAATPGVIPHWTQILRANLRYSLELSGAGQAPVPADARARAHAILTSLFDDLDRGIAGPQLRTIHEVTLLREHVLRSHGIADPYRGIKMQEAERLRPAAMQRMARAWAWGAQATDSEPVADLLAGLLAGNLFDLGSALTQRAFREGRLDRLGSQDQFLGAARAFLARLEPESLERLCARPRPLAEPPEGRVLLFADNAGADFLLGLLPAALFWAHRWEVCLVVNSLPVASDISLAEARSLLAVLGAEAGSPLQIALEHGRLRCIPSGTGSPGIDLRRVGRDLNRASEEVTWILLDGQGRAIETNWETRFRCGVLRCAVVKDSLVARAIETHPAGPILRWDPPGVRRGR